MSFFRLLLLPLSLFSISIDNLHADNGDDKENLGLEKMDQAGIGNVAATAAAVAVGGDGGGGIILPLLLWMN